MQPMCFDRIHALVGLVVFKARLVLLQDGKVKNTPWGSSFKKAPDILHGMQSLRSSCSH